MAAESAPEPPAQPPVASAPTGQAPSVAPAASPATPAQGMSSGTRALTNFLLIALGAGVMTGGFFVGRAYAPPNPPGEVANQMPADAVSKEELKKTIEQVEKVQADLDGLARKLDARPDYGPDIKLLRDEVTGLKGSMTDFPKQVDSLTQKIDTLSRTQTATAGGGSTDGPRSDTDKRLADLSAVVDNLRSELASRPAATATPSGVGGSASSAAMTRAIGLFQAKKFNEARDAFRQLQQSEPNDARITYYAALSNGWATREWEGETTRLVNAAMEQEKSGHPGTAQVDATFSNLTKAEGKEWLDGWRQRIKPR